MIQKNRLFILGKDTSVTRIKDFIDEYIDKAPESGKSILHTYNLQYLDAQELQPILEKLVKSNQATPSQQGQVVKEAAGGPQRYFEGVVIVAETPQLRKEAHAISGATSVTGAEQTTAGANAVYHGGNRLIIAAKQADWERIKTIIQKLDEPSMQVILEVLILDITADRLKQVGRNYLAGPYKYI